MDFERAQKYLESFVSYEDILKIPYNERHFDLERLKKFLDDYGVDYSKLKFVHVAGSKGKGSVSVLIARYLFAVGYKVGLFTSPHFLCVTERIWLNGVDISKKMFCDYVVDLKKFIDKSSKIARTECKLTYFEFLTVIALKFFVDSGVNYAVLEVGLGGRLDATNIVNPKLAVLTTIEKEHTDVLGKTLDKILNEKLGIVKKGVPLLLGFQSDVVKAKIKKKLPKSQRAVFVQDCYLEGLKFKNVNLVQKKNAQVAYKGLEILLGKVNLDLFKNVLENFKLIGRFDVRGDVVFDMAHTVSSIKNMIKSLKLSFPDKSFLFLVSIMKGKEAEKILKLIDKVASKVVLTSSHLQRGYSGKELKIFVSNAKTVGQKNCKIEVNENCVSAYKKTFRSLKKNQMLIVTGSHFLVAKILSET